MSKYEPNTAVTLEKESGDANVISKTSNFQASYPSQCLQEEDVCFAHFSNPSSAPVSVVVHGGTGILHGNMTSLTVNQYIGANSTRSGLVSDFTSEAIKMGLQANKQLTHHEEQLEAKQVDLLKEELQSSFEKPQRFSLWLLMILTLVIGVTSTLGFVMYSSPQSYTALPSFSQKKTEHLDN